MLQLILLPEAEEQLLRQLDYVERQFGFDRMLEAYDETRQQLAMLCKQPYLGRPIPGKSENERKYVLHRNLTVYYKIGNGILEVISFWNNHQNPQYRPE